MGERGAQSPTLLTASAAWRLAGVLGVIALLWLAVWWAGR
jgi:hypothetical protein